MTLLNTVFGADVPLITDPTWIFFVVLCIILLAPLALRRLRIPHVVMLILAGVLVGPYGLNLLARDASFELFGQVGIYYIMFLAGLELNMGSVEHYGRIGLKFGLLTFLVPFFLGLLVSMYVLNYGLLTSLLLSCIYSSHTLVSYPIVGRYGISRHRSVVVSVVATAFATFVSLLVLAFVIGSLNPETDAMTWIFFVLKCLIYGVFVMMVFPRVSRCFLRTFSDSVLQYIFILALVFLSAALAMLAGLEGLLGAFLAGLAVNRVIPKTSPLMNRVEFVGNAVFIPYFLIGVGMLVDVRILLSDWHTIWVVVVMVLTAALTKFLAACLMNGFGRTGGKWPGIWLMFGLTNAHAAGALAIVMIGTAPEVGLMDAEILNGTVMMIFFSCIISSLATVRGARQLALSDTAPEQNRGSYHGKCLITYSQEDNVDVMTQLAILIRNPYIPDSLMGLSVAYEDEDGSDVAEHKKGKELLEKAQQIAAAADVHMSTLNRISTNVATGILHTMKEFECGEVIMCLTDRTTGMPKSSLGVIIDSVVSGSHREVMAVRSIVPPGTMRRVVVAVPQKAEYEVGFYKWVEHICRIGEQLDCHLIYHAHPDTLPYIQGYMRQKHPSARTEYQEMPLWTQLLNLQHEMDQNSMLVIVTARPGFISYQSSFDNNPLLVHRYFKDTNVMLLYPDQWGDPMDTVAVFTPNGSAVTRHPQNFSAWLKQKFLMVKGAGMLSLLLLPTMVMAESPSLEKMSSHVRRMALKHRVEERAGIGVAQSKRQATARQADRICALVQTQQLSCLEQHECRVLASWGDIHIADIPIARLNALSRSPQILRIEAGRSCQLTNDTASVITKQHDLCRQTNSEGIRLTGKNVVVGLMDVGFDLTHPTFYDASLTDYRISSFWDQLDLAGSGGDSMFVGRSYTGDEILKRKHATDGFIQFHGTHTAGTAVGSGYQSPYAGMAPEADICLVANAVSGNSHLIADSLHALYTTATDLLGFKYIFDYARQQGKPCVISFSEGSFPSFWGDNQLAEAVLDSLTGPGRILCASAGNQGLNPTYLHKPQGLEQVSTMVMPSEGEAYQTISSSSEQIQIGMTFYRNAQVVLDSIRISLTDVLAAEDSTQIDTLNIGERTYVLALAAFPRYTDSTQVAAEIYLQDITEQSDQNHFIIFSLSGKDAEAEAFAYAGSFFNSTLFPEHRDALKSHNVLFPGCSTATICVGSTAYRSGVVNHIGEWTAFNMGADGELATFSSTGPTQDGQIKPDVVAPGTNVISAFSSYYLEGNKENWHTAFDVERFQFQGREYSWNAQSGTSMSTPVVAGIIALWLQAIPSLTRQDVLEAFAHTCRRQDTALAYPNNLYGYGEIDALAGLNFLLDRHTGILQRPSVPTATSYYDLSGRQIPRSAMRTGSIYLKKAADGSVTKIKY